MRRDFKPRPDGIETRAQQQKYIPKNMMEETKQKPTRSEESQSWQWMYKTSRYLKARRKFMARHPFCKICGDVATDLDHIISHRGDRSLFFDQDNWQSLCGTCHKRKTAQEDGGFGNPRNEK